MRNHGLAHFKEVEEAFVRAQHDGPAAPAWQPVRARGRWRTDAWGGGWFEVEVLAPIDV